MLDGREIKPDFYLPDYQVYVEFWGMADISFRYQKTMALKKALYKRNSIIVVSIYPRHLKGLENNFPKLFNEATGRDLKH